MKTASLLIAVGLAGTALVSSTMGKTAEPIPARLATTTKPVLVKVISPADLPRSFENAHVDLTMIIDQNGVPHDIDTVRSLPRDVTKSLKTAVAQWRFTPQFENGRAVSARVILPIQLVDNGE